MPRVARSIEARKAFALEVARKDEERKRTRERRKAESRRTPTPGLNHPLTVDGRLTFEGRRWLRLMVDRQKRIGLGVA